MATTIMINRSKAFVWVENVKSFAAEFVIGISSIYKTVALIVFSFLRVFPLFRDHRLGAPTQRTRTTKLCRYCID